MSEDAKCVEGTFPIEGTSLQTAQPSVGEACPPIRAKVVETLNCCVDDLLCLWTLTVVDESQWMDGHGIREMTV